MGAYYSAAPAVVEQLPSSSTSSSTISPPPSVATIPSSPNSSSTSATGIGDESGTKEIESDAKKCISGDEVGKLLNQVAAHTYSDIQRRLTEIQDIQAAEYEKKSTAIADRLRANQSSGNVKAKLCESEEIALLECLKAAPAVVNGVVVVKCDMLTNKYHACALKAYQSKK